MENKYYTPTIEEFHIGFDYEILLKDSWEQKTFKGFWGSITDLLLCETPCIRVKYLDQADIESFFFVQGKLSYQYTDGTHQLVVLDHNRISITHQADDCYLFYGKIKNKSELRDILKKVNVYYGV